MKNLLSISLGFLWLHLGWVKSQEEVTQSPQFLIVQEGDHVSMNCSYTNNAYTYFLWYKQDSGKGPDFLMDIRSNMDKKGNRRMTILLDKGAKLLSLNIMDAQPGDSSTYLCVASTSSSNWKITFGQGTRLTVTANIQNPQPALYQLRSPKSSNTSVCLLTDFGFYNGSIKNETVTGSEATVLEMMTMESKSYGAVTWGSKSNFTCTDAFRKDMFDFNQFSGSKCNSSHTEQGFETGLTRRQVNFMSSCSFFLHLPISFRINEEIYSQPLQVYREGHRLDLTMYLGYQSRRTSPKTSPTLSVPSLLFFNMPFNGTSKGMTRGPSDHEEMLHLHPQPS